MATLCMPAVSTSAAPVRWVRHGKFSQSSELTGKHDAVLGGDLQEAVSAVLVDLRLRQSVNLPLHLLHGERCLLCQLPQHGVGEDQRVVLAAMFCRCKHSKVRLKRLPRRARGSDASSGCCTLQFKILSLLALWAKRMYLWWGLCTSYLHACQMRVTVGDSCLCCCSYVTYSKR